MLIWPENALVFCVNDDDDDEDVTAFIDSIITCSKPIDDPHYFNLFLGKCTCILIHAVKVLQLNAVSIIPNPP